MSRVMNTVELAGAWCATAAGIGTVAALGAAAGQISAIRPHPTVACPAGAGGEATVPAMYAPWEEMPEGLAPQQRLSALIDAACRDMTADSGAEDSFAGAGRVILLLPPADSSRGRQLDAHTLQRVLAEGLPEHGRADVTVQAAEVCATAVVAGELAAISSGHQEWALIGAADSLVDPLTILQLLRDDRLRLKGRGGVAPGEACAFVLLRRAAPGAKTPAITMTATAVTAEPNHGQADASPVRGLGEAIRMVASQAGFDVQQCEHVFADLRDDGEGELEWWQTARALWPVTIPERYKQAVAHGVMAAPEPVNAIPPLTRIGDTYGDVGVASLFVQMAVAVEWWRCNNIWSRFGLGVPLRRWVICETAGGARRGVLGMAAT